MGISSKYPLLLTSGVTLVLGARLLVSQAQVFLQEHGGPALNRLQIWSVTFVFTCTSLVLIFGALADIASWPDVSRSIVLLAWGIPMVLLDMRNYWLPLRYTTGFWLTGLLFTLLPGSSLTLAEALSGSAIMFVALYGFHTAVLHLRGEEGFGLGDVHLIAALCAWFPWQLASLLSGCAFLLFVAGALLTRKTAQPYAPWLFALLAVLAGSLPHTSIQGVL
ncbi:prepilin peptidase [Yokenella regensburgei]|uniref:prepilin peptidase n=1 Tax=Enterobacteriaceae TaxID=543 RepID=UPI0024A7F88A|nr:A24 family peptidase [Klebsiella pneumoniae]